MEDHDNQFPDDFLTLSLPHQSFTSSSTSVDFTLSLFPQNSENLGAFKPISSTSVNFSSIDGGNDNPNSPFLTLFPQLPENLAPPPSSLVPPPSTDLSLSLTSAPNTSSTITTLQCSIGSYQDSSVFASSSRGLNGSGNCAPKRSLLQEFGEEKFASLKKIKLTKESSTNNTKQQGLIIRHEPTGEEGRWITKRLTRSDVNGASRLLLPRQDVNNYILPFMDEEEQNIIHQQLCGVDFTVFDMDTQTEHILTLKKWSTNSFHLVKTWTTDFVKRRNLKENDVISIRWEKNNSRFCFRVQMRNQVDGL